MPNDATVTTEAATSTATKETPNPYASGKLTKEISEAFLTGKQPAPPAKTTEPTATPDTSKETPSAPDGKSATATETVKETKQDRPKKDGPEARIDELTRNWREEQRRTAKLEQELSEARKSQTTQKEPPDSSAAATTEELKEPVLPELKDFEGKPMSEYDAALRKYSRELAAYEAKKAVQDYEQRQANTQRQQTVNQQLTEAKKRYPDWDTVGKAAIEAVWGDGKPESGAHPAVKHALGMTAEMTDLLYVLGGDKGLPEFIALSRRDPVAAIMELGVKRALLMPELAKAADELKNKGEKKDPPAKTKTDEPQLTREVGTRGTGPSDPAADAVRRANGKLTKEVQAEWQRKAALRFK